MLSAPLFVVQTNLETLSLDPKAPRSSVLHPRTPRNADPTQTQAPHAIEDRTKKEVMTVEATLERVPQALSPVDYRSLVERAIGKGGVGLTELRKETQDAGMVRAGGARMPRPVVTNRLRLALFTCHYKS